MKPDRTSLRLGIDGLNQETFSRYAKAVSTRLNLEWLDENIFQVIDRSAGIPESAAIIIEGDIEGHAVFLDGSENENPQFNIVLTLSLLFFVSNGFITNVSKA